MTYEELLDIVNSYGLIVKSNNIPGTLEVYLKDYPNFWDNKKCMFSNLLLNVWNGNIAFYTKLIKLKSGKYLLTYIKLIPIYTYTPKKLHLFLNRIIKKFKTELEKFNIDQLKEDFQ